ncbi:MAG: DUF4956 domain-containing protein [Saprospiraceae bacterium]|nr:DUF4956 domain-containing protein [Saprospiraceae bacterium]
MQDLFSLFSKIENPTTEMVIFTFIVAFLCSSAIALCYYFTTPNTLKTSNYIQALMLSSVIATMILQSIGDNVASGLGILGALTIINFRTNFKDPRDIIFMFAALGVGIACGSYVFTIAIIGTLTFCILAVSLKFTNFSLGNHLIWSVRLRIKTEDKINDIELYLSKFCKKSSLEGIKNTGAEGVFTQDRDYLLVMNDDSEREIMIKQFSQQGIDVRRFQNLNSESTEI